MRVQPIKSYKSPKYPTREFFISHPENLNKHIPLLWKSKKLVMNALVAFTLGNYVKPAFAEDSLKTSQEQVSDKDTTAKPDSIKKEKQTKTASVAPVFVHGEGRGTTGCVVIAPPVFLTEQEARQIINKKFKKENIIFDKSDMEMKDIVLDKKYSGLGEIKGNEYVTRDTIFGQTNLVLDAFSTRHNLGYEFVSVDDYMEISGEEQFNQSTLERYNTIETAEYISEQLKKHGKLNMGIFYDPVVEVKTKRGKEDEKDWKKAKKESIKLLKAQVDDFIDWIKKEGIIKQDSPRDTTQQDTAR